VTLVLLNALHLERPDAFRAAIERDLAWLPAAIRIAEPINIPD
jgi:hypothetical protein